MLPIYLIQKLIQRIAEFFEHWYVHSFVFLSTELVDFLTNLDQTFALKITVRNWSKPLYQDYTPLGYILGFIGRTGRIIIASLVYLFIAIVFLCMYLFWAAIPVWLILRIFIDLPLIPWKL